MYGKGGMFSLIGGLQPPPIPYTIIGCKNNKYI